METDKAKLGYICWV